MSLAGRLWQALTTLNLAQLRRPPNLEAESATYAYHRVVSRCKWWATS